MTHFGRRWSHLLLVGCTGMLASAARALSEQADSTTVVGRDFSRAENAAPEASVVTGDWRDPESLLESLRLNAAREGRFDLALLWIHRTGESLWHHLPELMTEDARVFEVVGSASDSPVEVEDHAHLFECHRRITLGHVKVPSGRRWLTHDEISRGVLRAIDEDTSRVVGEV